MSGERLRTALTLIVWMITIVLLGVFGLLAAFVSPFAFIGVLLVFGLQAFLIYSSLAR
jgi:hypothetical protein